MTANKAFLALALASLPLSAARAENCLASWTDAQGEYQSKAIDLDLASGSKLDPAALPESTAAIMCLRPSIVPLPNDIRVVIELSVAFGITGDEGPSLWIYAGAGRIKTLVEDGELSPAEAVAVNDWTKAAQVRFEAALAARKD